MDTSDYPSLSQLARLNAQLASHCARVDAVINAQLDSVERLFRAATRLDWDAVARASHDLARQPINGENHAVVQSAWRVCEALRRDPSGTKAKSGLSALLSACRSAKTRGGARSQVSGGTP
jgi:hypothetical protein